MVKKPKTSTRQLATSTPISFLSFVPKTERLDKLSKLFPEEIKELETFFDKPTIIYVDFANVIPWKNRLGWNIDIKRLKQLFDSFPNIQKVRFYYGELKGDLHSQTILSEARNHSYEVTTKPVKIIKQSIDVTSINMQSPDLLRQFISKPLLDKLSVQDIEYLNNRLVDLNTTGVYELFDRKCNFDVEIRGHIEDDSKDKSIENFMLWSGDCDFEEPIRKLKSLKKNVTVFCVRGHLAKELALAGAYIYLVYPLKNFICWAKQLSVRV